MGSFALSTGVLGSSSGRPTPIQCPRVLPGRSSRRYGTPSNWRAACLAPGTRNVGSQLAVPDNQPHGTEPRPGAVRRSGPRGGGPSMGVQARSDYRGARERGWLGWSRLFRGTLNCKGVLGASALAPSGEEQGGRSRRPGDGAPPHIAGMARRGHYLPELPDAPFFTPQRLKIFRLAESCRTV